MRSSASLGISVSDSGSEMRVELVAQLGREAVGELADRAGVDVAQPAAAAVVQRRRPDLLQQLLDHGADAHHLVGLRHHVGDRVALALAACAAGPRCAAGQRRAVGSDNDNAGILLGHVPHRARLPRKENRWPTIRGGNPIRTLRSHARPELGAAARPPRRPADHVDPGGADGRAARRARALRSTCDRIRRSSRKTRPRRFSPTCRSVTSPLPTGGSAPASKPASPLRAFAAKLQSAAGARAWRQHVQRPVGGQFAAGSGWGFGGHRAGGREVVQRSERGRHPAPPQVRRPGVRPGSRHCVVLSARD